MQSVSSRIWTRVAVSTSCDDNHYTTGISIDISVSKFQSDDYVNLGMNTFGKGIPRLTFKPSGYMYFLVTAQISGFKSRVNSMFTEILGQF